MKQTALPALMLARIDGKSQVEYLVSEPQRAVVRRAALEGLQHPGDRLGHVLDITLKALSP